MSRAGSSGRIVTADAGIRVAFEPRRHRIFLGKRVEEGTVFRVHAGQLESAFLYPSDIRIVVEVQRARPLRRNAGHLRARLRKDEHLRRHRNMQLVEYRLEVAVLPVERQRHFLAIELPLQRGDRIESRGDPGRLPDVRGSRPLAFRRRRSPQPQYCDGNEDAERAERQLGKPDPEAQFACALYQTMESRMFSFASGARAYNVVIVSTGRIVSDRSVSARPHSPADNRPASIASHSTSPVPVRARRSTQTHSSQSPDRTLPRPADPSRRSG